jgi:hypothetical protein
MPGVSLLAAAIAASGVEAEALGIATDPGVGQGPSEIGAIAP